MTGERAGSNWVFGNAKNGVLNNKNSTFTPKICCAKFSRGPKKKNANPPTQGLEKCSGFPSSSLFPVKLWVKVNGAPGFGEDFIHSSTSDVAGSEGMIPYLQEHILSGCVFFKNQPA